MKNFFLTFFSNFVKNIKMQLFYNPLITSENKTFTFDKEESKHIVKVLRKNIGDELLVTNGKGFLCTTKITEATEKKCVSALINLQEFPAPLQSLHIAIAPTKMNDRIEWFLEKATEIGISEVTFLYCKRSERDTINLERFEKIVIAAAKQSLQYHFPKINPFTKMDTFIKNDTATQKFIAHCEESSKTHLKDALKKAPKTTILIGPEGDFTPQEIKLALENNYTPISLGENRLRTETAGIMACAVFDIKNM